MEWLTNFWDSLTLSKILIGILILIVSFAFSFLVIGIVLVKIPADYFHSEYKHNFLAGSHPVLRWVMLILKNIIGILVILLGLVMTFPGVPGPGVLTILIGLILIDIPGKKRLETLIIKRPTILSAANNLRVKYHKPTLIID